MSDKLKVGLDDQASPGLNRMEGNIDDVGQAADKAEKELNQAAAAAKKLGDTGAKDTKKMSFQVTELNSGIELIRKGVELAARSVSSLADAGNPAAQSLVESFGKLGETMQALGDNKNVSDLMGVLASTITDRVIPAIAAVPGWFEKTSQSLAQIGTQAAEFTGFFPEGTTEALAEDQVRLTEIAEATRKINEEARLTYQITGKSEEFAARAAADMELRNLARLESERQLNDYLELEIENRQELSDKGELSGKKLAESDRRLEVIQRRLAEIPQLRANAESKAANEIAQAKIKAAEEAAEAEKEGLAAVAESQAEHDRQKEERLAKATAEANAAADRLQKVIQEAKGASGKPLLDEARASISPEATRAALVKKAQDEARQNVKLKGDDPRTWAAQSNAAAKQAGIQAFRDFNAGKTSEADIAGAQNSLIQSAAQQAQSRGQLDGNFVQALTAATRNQQEMVASQEQLAQQVKQLQAALSQVGNAAGRNNAQSRRSLLGN